MSSLLGLAWFVATATAVSTLVAAFASAGFPFELFSHFRWQYAAGAMAAGACFAIGRSAGGVVLVVTVAVVNLAILAPYLRGIATGGAHADGPRMKMIVANVGYRNSAYQRFLDYLAKSEPDLVVVSELTPQWRAALGVLDTRYPFVVVEPRSSPWGIGVWSRVPLRDVSRQNLGDPSTVNLRFTLPVASGSVIVDAVHLRAPTTADASGARDRQLATLAGEIANADPAVARLVVGDFNLTPFSPCFTRLIETGGLRDARRPDGLMITWPTDMPLLGIPIDHALVRGDLRVVVKKGPAVGSDHWPLEIALD